MRRRRKKKDYLNSIVGNSKSMKELARYDAGQNMEMRREMKKEKRGDDPNEEEERRRVWWWQKRNNCEAKAG